MTSGAVLETEPIGNAAPATRRLVIVSNRIPLSFVEEGGHLTANPSSGGLVSALDPLLAEHGGLWVGTRAHGLYRYRNGQLSHYTTANGLASDSIYSILEDKLGHFWFSGPSGVMLLNRCHRSRTNWRCSGGIARHC